MSYLELDVIPGAVALLDSWATAPGSRQAKSYRTSNLDLLGCIPEYPPDN